MAIIGKIRERMGVFLVIFVGLALALFTLEGLLTSNSSIFRDTRNDIAEIGGSTVSAQDFEGQVNKMTAFYKSQNKQDNIDQATTDMIREQAWSQLLSDMVYGKQYEQTHVSVGVDELWDMVQGRFVHPKIKEVPIFQDSITKQFKPVLVKKYLEAIQNDEKAASAYEQWLNFEDAIRKERLSQKYTTLLKQGLYVTAAQAKQDYIAKNRSAKIKYVVMNYNVIPDSAAVPGEKDLKNYYEKHRSEYKQETSRKIEYVTFDVLPSGEDKEAARADFARMTEDFRNAANDSEFVARNSETKSADESYHTRGSLSPALDSMLFDSLYKGKIAGPYQEGNFFKIAKVADVKDSPDSVKARHILIKINPGDDTLKVRARADSLKKMIKGGRNFADLAKKISEDPGSGSKGGDLGWFTEGTMVKPFNDACFNGKKGDLSIVESPFGFHVIEVQDISKKSKRAKIITIDRLIEPSSKTDRDVFNRANMFAGQNNSGNAFEKALADQKLNKRIADNIKENDKTIAGLESPRELVRWAYKAKKDEVSRVYQFGNKYVVAHLVEIKEKGIAPMEQVKDQVEAGARKEKKAALMEEKFKAALQGGSSIEDLGRKLNLEIKNVDYMTFASPYISGVGKEAEVVGTVFTLKQGMLSAPIQGTAGVFVAVVEQFTEAAQKKDFAEEGKQLQNALRQRVDYEAFNALKEKANIQDNRGRFY